MTNHLYLCLILCLGLLSSCSSPEPPQLHKVGLSTLLVTVDLQGTLKARDAAPIGPPGIASMWEFKITFMSEEGSVVEEGEVVARFDGSPLQEELRNVQNRLDSTKARIEKRSVEMQLEWEDHKLQRAEAAAEVRKAEVQAGVDASLSGLIEVEKRRLDRMAAERRASFLDAQAKQVQAAHRDEKAQLANELERAEREVADLNADIAKLEIKAPRKGTVVYRRTWGGEKKVGDEVWRGNTIMEIASLDEMMAAGTVDEADLAHISKEQSVRLRLEAHPDAEITGILEEVGNTVQIESRDIPSKVVPVELRVESPEEISLRPGMRFRGEIVTQRLEGVLAIPKLALRTNEEGLPMVLVWEDGELQERVVELGQRGKDGIEVVTGLTKGERILVGEELSQ